MNRPRPTAVVLVTAGALCLTSLPIALAGAANAAGRVVSVAKQRGVTTSSVTLVTGDRVTVGKGDGRHPSVSVTPAAIPGRHVAFSTWTDDNGDVRVVPSDMMPLLGTVLDESLFNVSALIQDGYDDEHSASLPLIVQHAPGAVRKAGALAGPSVHVGRELASINATAVGEMRTKAAEGLGKALAESGKEALARRGSAATTLDGAMAGVTHVWLDSKVKATDLDWNLNKIDAPAAWAASGTGKGVTVAVIDSGIDTSHPDLKSQVTESVNFSTDTDAVDHLGHGTHVAGTIAGTGEASGGARKGVAFDAKLLNVKVLNSDGSGAYSDIIAGMEWAAQHGAKVANMSLGGGPSDGTDPASEAVDELTAQYGTLFVVAAGNEGKPQTIGAPGAADSALTVAATDGDDAVTRFSSRGPRMDGAFKPDISAPGADIIEDRAAGTSMGEPVGQYYTAMSGTSMATPHVAGAAAVLAAQHPEYTAAQLKSVLQSSSHTLGWQAPAVVFGSDQGAGRLDTDAALEQQVVPDRATFDFGRLTCDDTAPITREVTLSNNGRTTASLGLSLNLTASNNLAAAPQGMATLSADQVSIPAGGSQTVTVTLNPGDTLVGEYAGDVVATPQGGGAPLHLAIGFQKSDLCSLHVSAVGLDGKPTAAGGYFVDLDSDHHDMVAIPARGKTLLLPRGHRLSFAMAMGQQEANGHTAVAAFNVPQVVVDRGSNVVMDMRQAKPVTADIPSRKVATAITALTSIRKTADGVGNAEMALLSTDGDTSVDFYAGQTGDALVDGTLTTEQYFRLVDAAHGTDTGHATQVYDLAYPGNSFPADMQHVLSAKDVDKLARIDADYRNLNYADETRGDYEQRLPSLNGQPAVMVRDRASAIALPIQRTEYITPGVAWHHWFEHFSASNWMGTQLLSAPKQYSVGERTHEDQLAGPFTGIGTGDIDAKSMTVWVRDMSDTAGNTLWNDNPAGSEPGWGQRTQVWQDGRPVFDFSDYVGGFVMNAPSSSTTWKVRRDYSTPGKLTSGNDTHTVWEYRTSPVTSGSVAVPMLNVAYDIPLDVDSQARPGRPLPIRLTVRRAPDAASSRVVSLDVSYSTDGGAHWQQLKGQAKDGRFFGVLPAKALTAGHTVALHVTAKDDAGSSIDQKLNDGIVVK
ncbi:S8 family serine peptidase [Streptomyces adustus]